MKSDRVYLLHIRDAVHRIVEYTRERKDVFLTRPMVQDAVVRNVEIIGEAVKNLSESIKANEPQVPWKRIAGMRDKMIHEYFGVNLQLVWEVVEGDLLEFGETVETMLQRLAKDG